MMLNKSTALNIAAFTLGVIVMVSILVSSGRERRVSLEQACWEYANRDHRLEISEKRFEELSKFGDPNDVIFFYQSCLGHVTGVPAQKEYMK